jgi:hypothetical protein
MVDGLADTAGGRRRQDRGQEQEGEHRSADGTKRDSEKIECG